MEAIGRDNCLIIALEIFRDYSNLEKAMNPSRRNLLKAGGLALALIPIVSFAAKNDQARASMKYKDSPEGDKQCTNCMHFVPGKSPTDLGGCKLFPGDTEVSPKGYCAGWMKKA